ncbi:CWF19-like protein 2 [Grammomys surdaster]|uniref:CWF19-like protein 2 n=1 Tax=Grammomys surdaster TaxID=491861 RepID=UPI00109FB7D3|nr:CWF19-like protein 2 [Grammomys surdaster]
MAAFGVRFESASSIEERKEQTRIARADVLRQAKHNFEKEQRGKELKQLRGEDTWMLPDVKDRIEQFSQEHSEKKKKRKDKHSKKVKKEKKKKRKKQKCQKQSESTDSSSSSEDEWVEAAPSQIPDKEKTWKVKDKRTEKECDSHAFQREEWMTVDFMSMKTVSSSSLKSEKETLRQLEREKTQALEQAKLLERELNPYWKDGGTGLPSENCVPLVTKATGVEDGGLRWLRKSCQRMKEQAQKENRKFEDVVAEKYGSVEVFQSKLKEAEKIACRREDCGWERWRKPAYSDRALCSQASGTSDFVKCTSLSEDRHLEMEPANSSNCKFRGPDTGKRSGTLGTCRRESALRKSQDSSGKLRSKFLRPTDEDELSCYKRRNFESSASKSPLVPQASLHRDFRKPTESSEESSTSWSRSGRGEENRKPSDQKQLETWSCSTSQFSTGDRREQLQAESVRGDPPGKAHLQDTALTVAGPEPESTCILSLEEKNKLGAKIIKAEMMGNMELAEQLKAQLKEANKCKETITQTPAKRSRVEHEDEQEVILTRTDASGRMWPVSSPGETVDLKAERRKRQRVSTHEDKERIRYFPDDDHLSLNDLVKNEKMGTDNDQNRLFMQMASKFMGKSDGDYYTLDDMFVSKAAEKEHFGKKEEGQRRRAVAEHQRLAAQMAKCLYCFDSSQFPKHLIVAIGVKVYLCLPNFRSLTEGHCLIVPLQHHQAATVLDEDIWEEIQMFRKSLVRMFEDKGLDCVFLETNMGLKRHYHMVYECIPLPKEAGDMAPIYFKKAIMESDEEWSMNKKLIDLSSKDIRKSVSINRYYFILEWLLQSTFVALFIYIYIHIFLTVSKEIIGGMLDLEPRLWRKGIRESFEDQRKKALQFAQWWKPYDVTKSKSS